MDAPAGPDCRCPLLSWRLGLGSVGHQPSHHPVVDRSLGCGALRPQDGTPGLADRWAARARLQPSRSWPDHLRRGVSRQSPRLSSFCPAWDRTGPDRPRLLVHPRSGGNEAGKECDAAGPPSPTQRPCPSERSKTAEGRHFGPMSRRSQAASLRKTTRHAIASWGTPPSVSARISGASGSCGISSAGGPGPDRRRTGTCPILWIDGLGRGPLGLREMPPKQSDTR